MLLFHECQHRYFSNHNGNTTLSSGKRLNLSLGRGLWLDIWSLEWDLGLRGDSCQVATFSRRPVSGCSVNSDTVLKEISYAHFKKRWSTYIPDDYSLWLPADTSLVVHSSSNVVQQECQKGVRLLLLQPHNATSNCNCQHRFGEELWGSPTARVDKQCLLSSSGVGSDERVLMLHRLPTHNSTAVSAELSLLESRM